MEAGFIFVLALFVAPFLLWRVFLRPALACLGFIIFVYFRMHEAIPALYPLKFPLVIGILMMLLLSVKLLLRQVEVYWTRELKLFLWFFIVVTIGIIFAEDRETALDAWSSNFTRIVIFVFSVTWLFYQAKDFAQFNKIILWCGIIIASIALYNSANGIDVMRESDGSIRVTIGMQLGSMLGDPNDLSLVLLMPISATLAFLLTAKSGYINKIASLVGLPLMLAAVKATQSRGGMLGVATIIVVYLTRRIRSKVLLVIIGGCALSALFVVSGIGDRGVIDPDSGELEESAMGRWIMWGNAIKMAVHHPFFGVGLANFANSEYNELQKAAHSMWFQVLGDTGFLGFVLFIMIFPPILLKAYHCVNQMKQLYLANKQSIAPLYVTAQILFAGIAGFFVSGSFLSQGFNPAIYILLAISIALQHFVEREFETVKDLEPILSKEFANVTTV